MVGMTVEEIGIYTVADLERERGLDERLRWELLEGELVMTPSPRAIHQQVALRLAVRLLESVDHDSVDVIPAPIDVHLSERTVLQRSGCPHYWVLDPDEVSLRAWHLVGGRYLLHAHAARDDEVRLTEPVDLTFRVADLLPLQH